MGRLTELFPQVRSDLKLVGGDIAKLTLPLRGGTLRRLVAPYIGGRAIAHSRPAIHDGGEGRAQLPVSRQRHGLRQEWGFADELVVGYCGNFGRDQDFSTILDAADVLRDNGDIRFLFIGDGLQRGVVEAEIARRRLVNVMLRPAQARRAESFAAPDVHLLSMMQALKGEGLPEALYPILAAGRAALFIGDVTGMVAATIGRAECGLCVEGRDGYRLAQVVAALGARRGEVTRMGANARALFVARCGRDYGGTVIAASRRLH